MWLCAILKHFGFPVICSIFNLTPQIICTRVTHALRVIFCFYFLVSFSFLYFFNVVFSVCVKTNEYTGGIKSVWNDKLNTNWIFMKEISSDGDVSTVDVVFPSSPFWFYHNSSILLKLLIPILAYANNDTKIYGEPIDYNLEWAPHHLGHWPICNLKPSQQEQMPIEETGNMINMITTIIQNLNSINNNITANIEWLNDYWKLLDIWANYLKNNLPDPKNQLCTDDFEGTCTVYKLIFHR